MPKKILVVGPSWVGDMVMAQSLFITLKERHPDCVIDVLALDWSLPLLERMPEVRRGIEFPSGHGELKLGQLWALGRTLRDENYDRAIVLPRSRSAMQAGMLDRLRGRTRNLLGRNAILPPIVRPCGEAQRNSRGLRSCE